LDDPQLLGTLGLRFLSLVFALGLVPAAGGAILWKTFQIAGVPQFTYGRCWKAYLAGCAWGLVLFIPVSVALGRPDGLEAVQIGIFFAATLLVVPLILWNFSHRVLVAEGVALAVIDLAIVLFIFIFRLH
jgi:hypothetical protein